MKFRSYNIKLYQALNNPKISRLFLEKHIEVLKSFGVGEVSSISNQWQKKPTVWLFVLENEEGDMIGGVRLDIKSEFKMPLEEALNQYPQVLNLAKNYEMTDGVAELCGLWIKKEYRRANLANALMKAAIATAPNIGVKHVMGFANEYSYKTTQLLGFAKIERVENNGIFFYPDERYKSFLIELNSLDFSTEDEKDLETILEIRENLSHTSVEHSEETVSTVNYSMDTESVRIKKLAEELKAELAA